MLKDYNPVSKLTFVFKQRSDILSPLDEYRYVVVLVLRDLSAASDTIDQSFFHVYVINMELMIERF